jgi:hypothetical protein
MTIVQQISTLRLWGADLLSSGRWLSAKSSCRLVALRQTCWFLQFTQLASSRPAARIDEIHTLVGAGAVGRGGGGGGGLDISNLIKPALARGDLQVGLPLEHVRVAPC